MKPYTRILLKLSGETLAGSDAVGVDARACQSLAREIAGICRGGREIAVVIGGGNFWRGQGKRMDRVKADYMGMLATVMNAIALQDALTTHKVAARVFSAIPVPNVVEPYHQGRALAALKKKEVVILAGGTGSPFFTTDTTAALRAVELGAQVLLKATQVDGVYNADPKKDPHARRFASLSFDEAIQRRLKVMDITAFSLCREHSLPIIVFDFHKKGNLARAVRGAVIGTRVHG